MKGMLYIIFLVSAMCFISCRSVQYVPVESVRTEIKYEKIKDSLRITDKVNVRDSIRMKDSVVTVVNDKGEVIRTEVYHWKERYSDINTLYSELKSKYDSLYSVKQDSIRVPYPVEKQLTKWQSMKQELGGWSFGVLAALLLGVIGYIVYRIIKK